MSTTWDAFYLGRITTTALDPTEGNQNSENAGSSAFVGKTFGSAANPLWNSVYSVQAIDRGGRPDAAGKVVLNEDNTDSNDQISVDLDRNGTRETYTFDGLATYNATITYYDNTTATISAVIFQTTDGRLFLAPAPTPGATNTLLTAKALQSIRLNSVVTSQSAGLIADRPDLEFACFASGVMIATDRGEVAVETLEVGDLVLTADAGLQPLRWIGRATLDLSLTPNLRPIRIKAGALGEGLPAQDLLVSPQHRVLIRSKIAQRMFNTPEVLVAAKQLVLLDGIDSAEDIDQVTYVHLLFDQHHLVQSNGALTESLFTGPEALKRVGPAAREEILQIFPQLSDTEAAIAGVPARPLVTGRQARRMAERHAENGRHLVA